MQEKNDFDEINEIKLITDRLILKSLDSSFYEPVLAYYSKNKEHFIKAMPAYPEEFFTREYWIDRLLYEFDMSLDMSAVRFYIFLKDDTEFFKIIGDVSIALIMRGSAESCKIGYKLDKDYTGNGYMKEALSAVVKYIFYELRLNRIEVNIIPSNAPSLNLIRKLNFNEEGTAYKYLKINGAWEDHLRFSLINPSNS